MGFSLLSFVLFLLLQLLHQFSMSVFVVVVGSSKEENSASCSGCTTF